MFNQGVNKIQDTKVDNAVYFSDEVNEIYFAETEIDDACEIVYSVVDEARKLHLILGHPPTCSTKHWSQD